MPDSRRQFLAKTSLGLLAAAVSRNAEAQEPSQLPPGAPSAFGTGPAVGPEVSPDTFAEAEKLARVELRPAERTQAAASWRASRYRSSKRLNSNHCPSTYALPCVRKTTPT